MAPGGVFIRGKGEQVLVHHCLGCGLERHNRVAADDDFVAVMRLPLLPGLPARREQQPVADASGQ